MDIKIYSYDTTMRDIVKKILRNIPIKMDISKNRLPILGRWSLHYDDAVAMRKADMTNEDHCGTCDKMRYDYIDNKDAAETIITKGYYNKPRGK